MSLYADACQRLDKEWLIIIIIHVYSKILGKVVKLSNISCQANNSFAMVYEGHYFLISYFNKSNGIKLLIHPYKYSACMLSGFNQSWHSNVVYVIQDFSLVHYGIQKRLR